MFWTLWSSVCCQCVFICEYCKFWIYILAVRIIAPTLVLAGRSIKETDNWRAGPRLRFTERKEKRKDGHWSLVYMLIMGGLAPHWLTSVHHPYLLNYMHSSEIENNGYLTFFKPNKLLFYDIVDCLKCCISLICQFLKLVY